MVSSSIYLKKNTGDSKIDYKDHFIHPKRITEKVEEEELCEDSPGYNRSTIEPENKHITLK